MRIAATTTVASSAAVSVTAAYRFPSNKKSTGTGPLQMVQSAARNFPGLIRNYDLKGSGERYFSDLDDGDDDDDDLDLDVSGYEVADGVTY